MTCTYCMRYNNFYGSPMVPGKDYCEEHGSIHLRIVPAAATPGKFLLSSHYAGAPMNVNGTIDDKSEMKYFDSEDDAREFVEKLPRLARFYKIVD